MISYGCINWFSTLTAEFDWLIFLFPDYKEFTQLLDQQATIDQYAEWASNLVNRCVLKASISSLKQAFQFKPVGIFNRVSDLFATLVFDLYRYCLNLNKK